MSDKGTIVKGWRTRQEEQQQQMRDRVWKESFDFELAHEGERRVEAHKHGVDTLSFIGRKVKVHRNVDQSARDALRRMQLDAMAERNRERYKAMTPEERKASRLAGRTEEEYKADRRAWHAKNRDRVNARKRAQRASNLEHARSLERAAAARRREKANEHKRARRSAMTYEQKAYVRLVSNIYDQLIRLAGLNAVSPSKTGGIGGGAPDAKQKVQASIPMVRGHKSKHADTPAARLESIFSAFQTT